MSKWYRRGYFPIKQALRMEQAFGIPAESMVEPALGTLLLNRPKKRANMKTTDKRAGAVIDINGPYTTWANVSKVGAVPDTYEVLLNSQYAESKKPDELQILAQIFLSAEGIRKLVDKLSATA